MSITEFKKLTGHTHREFAIQVGLPASRVASHIKHGYCSLVSHYRSKEKFTTKHLLYRTWSMMLTRCYNEKAKGYENYGGRGIKVCGRWFYSFDNFVNDMGERPEGYTLDRQDNDKGYSPDNCKWSSTFEQARNRQGKLGYILYRESGNASVQFRCTYYGTFRKHQAEQLVKDMTEMHDCNEWGLKL